MTAGSPSRPGPPGSGRIAPFNAEPVVIPLPAEIDMANTEDVGDQLRSAFTPGLAMVIADMTPTVAAGRPKPHHGMTGGSPEEATWRLIQQS